MERYRRVFVRLMFLVIAASAVTAMFAAENPPLAEKLSIQARNAVVRAAERYLGTPYQYGGESARGMDCSGLVYIAYLEATGIKVPRTVESLSTWTQKIGLSELQPGDLIFFSLQPGGTKADHVGIATGDRHFIHSTSQGASTGVIRSSLSEPAWSSRALYGGRALPSSPLPASILDFSLWAIMPEEDVLNLAGKGQWGIGVSAGGMLALPFGLAAGLETGFRIDPASGIIRVPFEFAIGRPVGLMCFAGHALTLSASTFHPIDTTDTIRRYGRSYLLSDSFFSTFGVRHGTQLFTAGSTRADFVFELRYDNYLRASGQTADLTADLQACVSASIGLRLRLLHY